MFTVSKAELFPPLYFCPSAILEGHRSGYNNGSNVMCQFTIHWFDFMLFRSFICMCARVEIYKIYRFQKLDIKIG